MKIALLVKLLQQLILIKPGIFLLRYRSTSEDKFNADQLAAVSNIEMTRLHLFMKLFQDQQLEIKSSIFLENIVSQIWVMKDQMGKEKLSIFWLEINLVPYSMWINNFKMNLAQTVGRQFHAIHFCIKLPTNMISPNSSTLDLQNIPSEQNKQVYWLVRTILKGSFLISLIWVITVLE